MKIAGSYETVAAMVASSLLQLRSTASRLVFVVVVTAESSWTASAVSAMDVSTSLVVEETAASNWSAIVATTGNMDCFVVTARRKETALAASAEGKSGSAGVTIVSNFDRVAEESGTKLGVAAMVASSWRSAFAAKIAGRNSVVEEMIASTH